jgi:DNA-binding response OmpR family regulator
MHDRSLKVLLIEDNDQLREATLAVLRQSGHEVVGIPMAEDLVDVTGGFMPDVYIIDVMLPDEDGLSLTRRLRANHPQAGIIITTALTTISDKVEGYASGADLYLSKPVHPRELIASLEALGNRIKPRTSDQVQGLVLQVSRLRLVGPNGDLDVSMSDVMILSAFVRAPGQRLERWQISEIVSTTQDPHPSASMIEMRIARVRKKLLMAGAVQPCMKAVHKVGYVLCCPVTLE